jgi:hypothetical protein
VSHLDLRRLPLVEQLAAVRRYAQNRESAAATSGGLQDFVYPEHIARKFRCVCPDGLWQMWANDVARRFAARRQRERAAILEALAGGQWGAPRGSLARLNGLRADGVLERRRNPSRASGAARYEWRIRDAVGDVS